MYAYFQIKILTKITIFESFLSFLTVSTSFCVEQK